MYTAQAHVNTDKAERYLKALCNHFSRKVTAEYNAKHGSVQFGFGVCSMDASSSELTLYVQAETTDDFERVKVVVADHLERFSGDDKLQVQWIQS